MANPIVTITMENGDVMKAELYPEIAPITVENFVNLVKDGFYDGLTFHRIINGFMIQGGCPLGTGTGGPDQRRVQPERCDQQLKTHSWCFIHGSFYDA
jgi:peptidyl-prolyl cis-trans isomerase B (cyclophilin B)